MPPEPGKAATIRDVAAAAGVSRAAVSKVLRDAYGVSDAMRERVNAAMEELNYRPRIAARAMRGKTYTIGVEIPDFSNQFFSEILDGMMARLAETSYQIVIAPADRGPQEGLRAIDALVDRQVDGIVAVSPRVGQARMEETARHTPVLMLGRHDRSTLYDTVAADDIAGTDTAIAHLRELGHKRIAHLTLKAADPRENDPHGIRLRRFRELTADAGEPDVIRTDEGQAAATRAVRAALHDGLQATAIFAAHDELALGALRALGRERSDVSVIGYDDVPIAGHPFVELTSIAQPGHRMGERAADLLLDRIGGRQSAEHVVFTPELVVRATTRAPHTHLV